MKCGICEVEIPAKQETCIVVGRHKFCVCPKCLPALDEVMMAKYGHCLHAFDIGFN